MRRRAAVLALALAVAPVAPARAATSTPAVPAGANAPVPSAAELVGLTGKPAPSPELLKAQAAAVALQAKVDALEVATEQAVEHYDAVAADLAVAEQRHQDAAWQLELAREDQAVADKVADARVRSLYQTGGPPGLASLAVNGDGTDLLDNYGDTRWVLQQDRLRLLAARRAAAQAAAAERRLAAAVATEQKLQRAAAAARKSVEARLAQQRALLASASAQVKALLAAQQRAEAAAAAALARQVEAARKQAGGVGVALHDAKPSSLAKSVLAAAESALGKPYQWGGTGPAAYDCSGLVQHAFAAAGVALPRTAAEQWYVGTHPAYADAAPGDLLFWSTTPNPATIHHVAIYLGGGYMIAAPHTGTVVQVQRVYPTGFFGVTRIATR